MIVSDVMNAADRDATAESLNEPSSRLNQI